MTGMIKATLPLFFAVLHVSASAVVLVPNLDEQLKTAPSAVLGKFQVEDGGRIFFVVEESLKGKNFTGVKLKVDKASRIAWRPSVNGFAPISEADFRKAVVAKSWFKKRVILVGSVGKGSHWKNLTCVFSIWPRDSGSMKGKTIEQVASKIRRTVGATAAED